MPNRKPRCVCLYVWPASTYTRMTCIGGACTQFPFSLRVCCKMKVKWWSKFKKVVFLLLLPDIICGPMYSGATPCPIRAPLVVVVVGQPCRGKSLAAHKVARQLNWKGEQAKGRSWWCFCCHSWRKTRKFVWVSINGGYLVTTTLICSTSKICPLSIYKKFSA